MDIGKTVIKDYGWREGGSLREDSDADESQSTRPNYKFDTHSKKLTNHWWEQTLDQAFKNVNVEQIDEISLSVHDTIEITTKACLIKKSKRNKRKSKYKNFLKTSVLEKSFETTEQNHVDLENFRRARQKFLTLLNKSSSETNTSLEIVEENIKHESVNILGDEDETDYDKSKGIVNITDSVPKSKKRRKKNIKICSELSIYDTALEVVKTAKKKKRKRKRKTPKRHSLHRVKNIGISKPSKSLRSNMGKKLKKIYKRLTAMKL